MAIKASNQISVIDITDGYSVILTNESHTFIGTTSTVKGTQSAVTQIMATCGSKQVACSIGTVTAKGSSSLPSGISVVNDKDAMSPTLTITATSAVSSGGTLNIPVQIGDVTINKLFSYTIAYTGATGAKGDQGIPGTSSYTHIAYATNATGTTGFSTSDAANKTYIGMCVDNSSSDPTDPSKYKWTLIKGAKGDQGIPGKDGSNGANGATAYFHIAYADSADGKTNFTTDDSKASGKLYIGQYTDHTAADSTNYTSYHWTRIKGDTGAQGPKGVTGAPGADGADAINLIITSSAGFIFKNTNIATTLTAHVYKGAAELSATQIAGLGTIKWYKDGGTSAVGTGTTLTISAGNVTNKASYVAQLEG